MPEVLKAPSRSIVIDFQMKELGQTTLPDFRSAAPTSRSSTSVFPDPQGKLGGIGVVAHTVGDTITIGMFSKNGSYIFAGSVEALGAVRFMNQKAAEMRLEKGNEGKEIVVNSRTIFKDFFGLDPVVRPK